MEGTTSINTILLIDVEVGSSPPYIYICTNPPEKRQNNNRTIIELKVSSLENPKIVN